jgi:hypothetical protein
MGNNAARLFGYLRDGQPAEPEPATTAGYDAVSPIITELADAQGVKPTPFMAVSLVAHTWPQTRAVFEQYGIPWKDTPVPFWEPVAQAAAARRMGPKARQKLMDELIEAAGTRKGGAQDPATHT